MTRLRRVSPAQVARARRAPVDAATLATAAEMLTAIEAEGLPAILRFARRFGDVQPGEAWCYARDDLTRARDALAPNTRALLERTAQRIDAFARAQRACLRDLDVPVPGGRAGHAIVPVARAGCYAPGGRYPLPSSVLMTAVTARAAGVAQVWVASPKPGPVTLAAAAIADADGLLALGGVQAIASLALGAGPVPAADLVVGPGNRFVTAAKQLLFGRVGIEALAGPSELVVLADDSADPALVAADLLAQAEHDADAWPVLVTNSTSLAARVDEELATQLADLPTAETANAALAQGLCVIVDDLHQGVEVCDALAPEHLALLCRDAEGCAARVLHAGAVFVGPRSAEVFGDYGAGPNHVLPTGGGARFAGGLSVLTFLRTRTWLALAEPAVLAHDAAQLARLEGLEAHARAAERRRG